ncbi:uncharacterized protein BCR38DRAFT_479423 [Pseudomassariella vexata]|uniref:Dcp1-like decapping family-domain-containing protein n=1 Tax=Pseudomassariella vexata TaxID=1141098 RepID=A0A1Y2EJA1_9PEZI|nr:uncharacterized protein BCR38DRAFT_479423 [Pseudomassariella vexata]ORY70885.1 hypothetical protein BCR38DRAFT_479423 [Pseudomassariella vexata]
MSRQTPRKKGNQQQSSLPHQRNKSQQQHQPQILLAHIHHRDNPPDYGSDTASYMASHPVASSAGLAQRSNTDLNLSVLKRYLPSIHAILSIAANAVVYTYQINNEEGTQGWEKFGVEGTMFVCSQNRNNTQTGTASTTSPGAEGVAAWDGKKGCVFILNRRGLENMVLDLAEVENVEATDELLIFQLEDKEGLASTAPRVMGLWIHADEEATRATNTGLIQEMWRKARES